MFNLEKLPVWIRFVIYIFSFCMVIGIAMCVVFFHELYEYSRDKLINSDDDISSLTRLNNDSNYKINGFVFYIDHNNIKKVKVSNLSSEAISSSILKVKFDLENLGGKNDFPNIDIIILDDKQKVSRTVPYTNVDYIHSEEFKKQTINIDLQIKNGESSFTVKPFYPPES